VREDEYAVGREEGERVGDRLRRVVISRLPKPSGETTITP
jgi:hypothetical protein